MRRTLFYFVIIFCIAHLSAPRLFAAQTVSVNAGQIISTNTRKIGINTNYLMDDDHNRSAPKTTTQALTEMGTKFLRYPGGEKADAYLWSVPPFDRSIPTLARTGSCEWPSNDTTVMQADGETFKIDPLDFDEFMTMARSIGAEPVIVVAYDSMYKGSSCAGTTPTRQQLIDTAVAWVRYANITKKYNVKYWEIGNETYLDAYNGSTTAANYANDLKVFSQAMKQVDPTIKIGANGNSDGWWKTIIQGAGSSIDFLVVHNYLPGSMTSYESYRTQTPGLTADVSTAVSALNAYASAADKSRIRIFVTETNAVDWSDTWANNNDIGHALAVFEQMGEFLKQSQVDMALFWNTRWMHNNTSGTAEVYDALSKTNQFNAVGRVLAVWNLFLQDRLVSTAGTTLVRTFASINSTNDTLVVFLENKDTQTQTTTVNVTNFTLPTSGKIWVFKGTSPTDTQPTWEQGINIPINSGSITKTLDPLSVTVIELSHSVVNPACRLDLDGNKQITTNDLKSLLSQYDLVNAADINNDSKINLLEFAKLIQSLGVNCP